MGVGGYSKHLSPAEKDFDATILEQLPENVKQQFEKYDTVQNNLIEELKEKNEKLLVDSEQKHFEIEKQLTNVTSKYTTESNTSETLKKQLTDLEKRYNDASHQVRELQATQYENNKRCDALEHSTRQLSSEKEDLVHSVDKKTKEIDTLTENWKQISDKLNVANRNRIEALTKLEEAQSRELVAQHHDQRSRQEVENLQQQNKWLQKEIQEKTDQLLSSRKDQAATILELQSALEERCDEVVQLEGMVDSYKLKQEEQNKSIEGYLEKLAQARDNQSDMDGQYRAEIQSQEKLINIYKTATNQKKTQVEELLSTVEEMRTMLKEAVQDRAQVEREKDVRNQQLEEEVQDRDQQISQLERELENANELIDAMKKKGVLPPTEENIEALSPSAAAASRLLKSGMTLTQIYSEYVQTSEDLLVERAEKERLSQHLDQIIQEIEQKAPILKKQREDYEQSLETINLLTGQLDTAMVECHKLQTHGDECLRRKNEVSRENLRLQQTSVDLGQQVRMLLKELEEARGTVVTMHNTSSISSLEVTSSSQVISDNLVTFKSIEELQEQNQRLLEVVRDLSEQREKEEADSSQERVKELKGELDHTLAEVEEMKAARHRQAELVESIVRQRDMYKLMLSQTGVQSMESSPQRFSTPMMSFVTPKAPTATSPITEPSPQGAKEDSGSRRGQEALEETSKSLKELQEEFSVYRREKGENEKILNEQLEKMRSEMSEMRVLNAKLASQLDFSSERYKVVQSNVEGYKKEIAALRDKVQKLTASNAKHEQSSMTLRQELMAAQERLSRAEAMCQSLSIEKEMLKAMESRLLHEKESIIAEHRSRDMLMVNLQSIQNNLDRAEFETKTQYTQKIKSLEKENATLQRRLDGLHDEQHKRGVALEKQLADTRLDLDRERNNNRGSADQLKHAADKIKNLEIQLAESESKLSDQTSAPDPKTQHTLKNPELMEEIKDLKAKLDDSNNQIRGVTAQRDQFQKEVEQYKSIASSVEQNLKEQNEISKQLQDAVTSQLEEAKKVQTELKDQLKKLEQTKSSLEKEKESLVAENTRLSQGNQYLGVNQRKQLEVLQKEMQKVREERDTLKQNEQVARTDCDEQAQLAKDAQETYQRELMQHAADVAALTTAKEELQGYTEKLRKAEEQTVATQETLEASKLSWKEQEHLLKAASVGLETKVKELQTQNRLVHEELEAVSQKMVKLQHNTEREAHEQRVLEDSLSHADEERSAEQLLEVVRFIRKEKDIAETRLDIAQAEANRLKQQTDYLQKQMQDATQSLSEERQKSQATMHTAAQHADLIRKVEMLNLLQDSNKMLREEKDRMAEQITSLEKKVQKLETDIVPLQEAKTFLQGQYEAIEIERNTLQAELQRWKARTNHLIEQCNKADPEEFKRMMLERDQSRVKLASCNEDIQRLKAEVSKVSGQLSVSQTELANSNKSIQSLKAELATLKEDIETRTKDQEEKMKTITKLRQIGRKYRMQAEDVQKELDDLKSTNVTQKLEEAHQAKIKELEEAKKKADGGIVLVTEKLAASEAERAHALMSVKEKDTQKQALEEKITKLNTDLTQEKDAAKQQMESMAKLKAEAVDMEKKYAQSRSILTTAKNKLSTQRGEIDKLVGELEEVKKKSDSWQAKASESEAQASAIRSQYENRIAQMQQDLDSRPAAGSLATDNSALLQELETLKKKNSELTSKLLQLQKRLETMQGPQTTSTVRPKVSASSVDRPGTSTGEAVKTANIKPMTTPTTSSRPIQSALVQPVRSADRFRASVPPMTVATTSTITTMQTPTATVMPTTVTIQDSDSPQISSASTHPQMSPQHLQQSQQMSGQTRPMQQVQPVTQRVDEVQGTFQEEQPEPQSQESLPSAESSATSDDPAVPSTSHAGAGVGAGAAAAGPTSGKRMRDDTEMSDEQGSASLKRRKSQLRETTEAEEPSTASGGEVTTPQPEPRETVVEVALVEPAVQQQQQPPVQREEQPQAEQQMVAVPPTIATLTPEPQQQEDSLVLESGASEVEGFDEEPEVEEVQEENVTQVEQDEGEISPYDEGQGSQEEEDNDDEEQGSHCPSEGPADNSMEAPSTDINIGAGDEQDNAIVLIDDGDDDVEEQVDDDEEDVDQMEDYVDEEEDEQEEEDEEEEEDGDLQEGMQESYDEEDEEMDEEIDEPMQAEEDDDVILVDDEPSPEEAVMEPPADEPQSTSSQPQTATQPSVAATTAATRQLPQLSRLPSQQDRLMPIGRAQQLPPFSFGEQSGFDVGDDGIVPSTPTLLVPRRHDDFAQAVSSPQIQRRFVFGAGSDAGMQPPDFGRLESQGALGVDDIRMDLTQFDDASGQGRSVPVVPTIQTTPTISVTEPSPPRECGEQAAASQGGPGAGSQGTETNEPESQQLQAAETKVSQAETAVEGQGDNVNIPQAHAEAREQGDAQIFTSEEQESDKPGTSEGDKSDPSGSGQRPRIQRIVWDKPIPSGAPTPLIQATPQPQPSTAPVQIPGPRKPQPRFRGQVRGQGFTRMQRPMFRGSGSPQPQGIPRARGMRGGRRPYQHQQQRQPPF